MAPDLRTVLVGLPLTITEELDPHAVDKQVPGGDTVGRVIVQEACRPLTIMMACKPVCCFLLACPRRAKVLRR